MTELIRSYLAPTLDARSRPEKGGYGIFAHAPTPAGTVLLVWGGAIVNGDGLQRVPDDVRRFSVQVEEDLYLVSLEGPDAADYLNHSCDPNAGFDGQIVVVAIRDIAPEEEVCIDYAMCDSSPYDEFDCACGAATCRGRVTGNDWMRPDLQARYAGYFMPYLRHRIARQAGER